jgi:hypothetical protein
MNMIDLAKASEWKDVKRAVRFHYPTDKNDYERLFGRIKTAKARGKGTGGLLTIDMSSSWDIAKNGKLVNSPLEEQVYMVSDVRDDMTYSLSFVGWNKLMRTGVSPETIKSYTKEEILAHFLWEITFYGSETDMRKAAGTVKKRAKSVSKGKKA